MPQLQHEFCTVPDCGRPHKARGYCEAHYQHHLRGIPIKPVLRARDTSPPAQCTEPGCTSPPKGKGLCAMHYARKLRHGHTRFHDRKRPPKPCLVEGCENHLYAKGVCHLHYMRKRKLRDSYGITLEQEAEMMAAQGDKCAICDAPSGKRNGPTGKLSNLCVDHCHKTLKVRGLLCDACNTAIGLLQDSPAILLRAAAYLEKHQP